MGKKTFWCGKREREVDMLNMDIPASGEVTDKSRPILEEWRKLQNAYYRYYNDGDAFFNKLRHMADRFNVKLYAYRDESLEELADVVFEAALTEQAGVKARAAMDSGELYGEYKEDVVHS